MRSGVNAIVFSAARPVDLASTMAHIRTLLRDHDQVVVLVGTDDDLIVGGDGSAAGALPIKIPSPARRPDCSTEVASYREGYADGYVDCLTIMGQSGAGDLGSPTTPL